LGGVFVYDGSTLLIGLGRDDLGDIVALKAPDDAVHKIDEKLVFEDGGKLNTVGRLVVMVDDSELIALRNGTLTQSLVQILVLLGLLATALTLLMEKLISAPIRKVVRTLEDIAKGDGDLTNRLRADRDDEIGQLAKEFNLFVDKIHHLVTEVVNAVKEIGSSTEKLNSIALLSSKGVGNQRTETDSVATAMTEMSSTARDVAQNANMAAESARQADLKGHEARDVVLKSMAAIHALAEDIQQSSTVITDLEKDVENITTVLSVIRGIAEQTNLLALNAAIEAARAGEQGRGFAVVADEVRTLASKTQKSTEEIQHMIVKLQSGTQKAVNVMHNNKARGDEAVGQVNQAEKALNEIADSIATINDMNTQIASSAEEQTNVTEDINRSLVRIVQIAEETASGTRETENASKRLAELASSVRQLVNQFRI
jgi:methyl-accepting chemotaxis protein